MTRSSCVVTGLEALAALRAQARAVGLAQRGDRLLDVDRLDHERPQLQLVVIGQARRLRVPVLLERDGHAAADVDGREHLLVDPDLHRRHDRPQAACALPGEGGGQPGVEDQAAVRAGEPHRAGHGLGEEQAIARVDVDAVDRVLAHGARRARP